MSHNCAFVRSLNGTPCISIPLYLSYLFSLSVSLVINCQSLIMGINSAWSLRYGAFWAKLLIILLITPKIHLLLSVRSRRTVPTFLCATVTCRSTSDVTNYLKSGFTDQLHSVFECVGGLFSSRRQYCKMICWWSGGFNYH